MKYIEDDYSNDQIKRLILKKNPNAHIPEAPKKKSIESIRSFYEYKNGKTFTSNVDPNDLLKEIQILQISLKISENNSWYLRESKRLLKEKFVDYALLVEDKLGALVGDLDADVCGDCYE
jgi:hypothetical protein